MDIAVTSYNQGMRLLSILLFMALSQLAKGAHTTGADIAWEYLGNDKYKIIVGVFRDCNGVNLLNTPIKINGLCKGITKGTQIMSPAVDITPLCMGQCNRCTSRGCSFQYGFEKILLTVIIDVSTFRQNGCCNVNLVWAQCCRPFSPTTKGELLYVDATFDVCQSGGNNSPKFESAPPTLICLGKDLVRNLGAIDIDTNALGQKTDSLAYTLIRAKQDSSRFATFGLPNPKKPIHYLGYPKNYTLSQLPFGFHFDSSSAEVFFRPMRLEATQWVVQVDEYRNGKKISQTKRDFQVIVMKCPNNDLPILSGAQCKKPALENFDVYACAGQPVYIRVCSSDKNAKDTVKLDCRHSISGASYSIVGNKNEALTFSWTPKTSDIRTEPYSFVVEAKDNACPIQGEAERVYNIYVGDTTPFQISTSLEPINANCGEFWLKAKTTDNVPSHQWNWYLNDTVLLHSSSAKNSRDSFKYKFTGNGVHNFTIKSSRSGCFETFKRSINMTGLKPIQLPQISDTSLCKVKRLNTRITAKGGHGGLKYHWINSDLINSGQSDTINFLLRQPNPGSVYTRKISYTVTDTAGCSVSDEFEVLVKRKENLELMRDTILCGGDLDTLLPITLNANLQGKWNGDGVNNGRFSSKSLPRKLYKLEYYGENAEQCILDTVDIGIYNLPNVSAGRNLNGCPNMRSLNLNGTPKGGKWWGSHINRNQFVPPKNISGIYTFSYYFEDSKGCANTDTTKLTVLPYVAKIDAGSDTFLCGQPGLFALAPNPSTGTWKGFNLEVKNGTTYFNSSFAQTGKTYSLIFDGYDSIGCQNSDTLNISMKPRPAVDAGPDLEHCFKGPKDLVQLAGKPKGGVWAGDAIANSSQNLAIDINHLGTSKYAYTITDSIGCTNTAEMLLTVRNRPKVDAGSDDTICLSKATYFNLIGIPTGGVWNGPGAVNKPSISRILLHNSLIGKQTYVFSYKDQLGCSNTDSLHLYIGTKNDALFTPSVQSGKAPLTVSFSNQSVNATSHLWDFGNGDTSSDFEPQVTYQLEGAFVVWLTTTDATGFCNSKHADTIVVKGNVGIDGFTNQSIEMYPNPARRSVTLKSDVDSELILEVINASGSTMSTGHFNEQITLNLEALPSGLYLVKIANRTGLVWTSKLQVQ